MGVNRQRTLASETKISGIGLHTGVECKITLSPAAAGAGIVFRRTDFAGDDRLIPASPANVVFTNHGTMIANDAGATISTVEHLMAALALAGVDNVRIDVDGPEIPILDGSAAPFLDALRQAGGKNQIAERQAIEIQDVIEVRDGDRMIMVEPNDDFVIEATIDFHDCMIGRQSVTLYPQNETEHQRLARARTFCRLHDVECLRTHGLIRGGSLHNSIVVDGDRLLNGEALRDEHEFVLHKALDLLGDLYLLGAPIQGAVTAVKPGHDLNTRLAYAIAREYGLVGVEARESAVYAAAG